jgi:hypothetical protein
LKERQDHAARNPALPGYNWERIESAKILSAPLRMSSSSSLRCNWERIESSPARGLFPFSISLTPCCNWERIESWGAVALVWAYAAGFTAIVATGKELKA